MKARGKCDFILAVSILGLLNSEPVGAAQGVISKESVPGSSYCRLRFPAIREETLFSSRPQLKDPADGDIIDFYGPCDHDPLGITEIRRQRADVRRERRNDNDSD